MQMGDDQPQPDSSTPMPDAAEPPIDAPVEGVACTTNAVEVGRITGASIHPSDPSFYGRSYKQGIYTRDADHDGKADVMLFEYNSASGTTYNYQIRLWLQTATGFAAPITTNFTVPQYGAESNAVGDFNGDGLLDVIFTYSTETPQRSPFVYVATQQANHTFSVGARIDVSACMSSTDERLFGFAITDLDRDGKDDVMTTVSYGGLGASPLGLTLLKGGASGLGSGTCIQSSTVNTIGVPAELYKAQELRAGDFDGDGKDDLVASIADKYQLFRSTGPSAYAVVNGTWARPTWRVTFTNAIAGRMRNDLVNADIGSGSTTNTKINRLAIDPMTGVKGALVATLNQSDTDGSYGNIRGVVSGDLNGDGLTDVLVAGSQGSTTTPTFSMTCDRTARWDNVNGSFPTNLDYLRAIDIDGDQRTEVLGSNGTDLIIYAIR